MKQKSLAILFAVTVVMVIAAVLSSPGGVGAAGPRAEALADYPRFSERLNDVNEVEIVGHDQRFRVRKGAEGWGLVDRSGYPVSFEKVKDIVVRLSELEPLDAMSARPENFARMGLQDPEQEGSTAKRVILRDASEKTIADLLIGETRYRGRTPAVFVRPAQGNETYLCEGRLTFEADPMSWIEREVLKLEAGQVTSLVVEHADGETIRIRRQGESKDYELVDVPAGKQESFKGVANGPATALGYLRLEDVRPLAEVDFSAQPVCKAVYACEDGLVITVEIARFEEADWARLSASYQAPVEPPPAEQPAAAEPPAEAAPAEAQEAPHAEVEARALQRTFDRWAYELPEFKVQGIAKRGTDLWIDQPAEPAPETPSEPADPGQ